MAEDTKSRGLMTDLVTSEIQDRVGQFFKKETEDDKNEEDGMTWKEHFFNSTAVFAVATSLTAIFIESSMIVTIVGVLCSFLGGAAALQQAKISEIESKLNTIMPNTNAFFMSCFTQFFSYNKLHHNMIF